MAFRMGSLFRTLLFRNVGLSSRIVKGAPPSRTAVSSTSGAILPQPDRISFGFVRITVVVIPFLYMGALISKSFADLLEEHDIFVPDDDDD